MAVVLERADTAIAAARGMPCAGMATALAVRAQIASMVNDKAGARHALDEQARTFGRLPSSVTDDVMSALGWSEHRLLHTRSFVATHAGLSDADQAQREAFDAYPVLRIRPRVQIKLHQAMSMVSSGDISSGIDHARSTLSTLAVHDWTTFIRQSAFMVLDAVPPSERTRPAVVEYRELLTSSKASMET
jgi:hypothetical protein